MANPWDVAAWPEEGNSGPDVIFLAVGKALSHWELVEQAIAGLFTVVTVGSYYAATAPAIRAYGAVSSSGNRVQMVRAAVESFFHEWPGFEFQPHVMDILSECDKWAARRNEIAHGIVDRLLEDTNNGWYLFSGLYNIKKRPLGGRASYRYTAANIDYYSESFVDLHNRLNELQSALGEWHRIARSQRESQKK